MLGLRKQAIGEFSKAQKSSHGGGLRRHPNGEQNKGEKERQQAVKKPGGGGTVEKTAPESWKTFEESVAQKT